MEAPGQGGVVGSSPSLSSLVWKMGCESGRQGWGDFRGVTWGSWWPWADIVSFRVWSHSLSWGRVSTRSPGVPCLVGAQGPTSCPVPRPCSPGLPGLLHRPSAPRWSCVGPGEGGLPPAHTPEHILPSDPERTHGPRPQCRGRGQSPQLAPAPRSPRPGVPITAQG